MVHKELNDDIFPPVWYISTPRLKVMKAIVPIIQKSQDQIDDEEGATLWSEKQFHKRHRALVDNGVGLDADQGQFSAWSSLGGELRKRILVTLRHCAKKSK